MKGQTITIYFDPDDPTDTKGNSSSLSTFILIIGSVSLLISVMIFFYKGRIDTSSP